MLTTVQVILFKKHECDNGSSLIIASLRIQNLRHGLNDIM